MRTFTVVVHHEPQGGCWGEVPELPGCFSQGETVDELLGNIKEAIALYLEDGDDHRGQSVTTEVMEVAI